MKEISKVGVNLPRWIWTSGVNEMDIPFWVYFVVVGIIISAYMVMKTGREERRIEEEIIEKEGEIYIERLEKERLEKKDTKQSLGTD